jgi:hypothetical protein
MSVDVSLCGHFAPVFSNTQLGAMLEDER